MGRYSSWLLIIPILAALAAAAILGKSHQSPLAMTSDLPNSSNIPDPAGSSDIAFSSSHAISTIDDIPVFDYFAQVEHFDRQNRRIQPGLVPHPKPLESVEELKRLIGPDTRIELKREEPAEVRVINTLTGAYRYVRAEGDHDSNDEGKVREIIRQLDEETRRVFDGDWVFESGLRETEGEIWRHTIMYDEAGRRVLPAIRKAGEITSAEEFWKMRHPEPEAGADGHRGDGGGGGGDGQALYMEGEGLVLADRKTGDVWVVGENVMREVDQRLRYEEEWYREIREMEEGGEGNGAAEGAESQ